MENGSSVNVTEDWRLFVEFAPSEESYIFRVIFSIALLIIFAVSLVGNTLTCVVIYSDITMHTATNCYLFNLAVSDLLASFPILIFTYQFLTQDNELVQFNNGVWSCKLIICIHFVIISILWNNGIIVMTVLSIERYIAICYPMMLKGTPVWRRVGKIITMIWTVAILETLLEHWMINVFDNGKTLICYGLPNSAARILSGLVAVITFIIPLGIMIFMYTMIAFKVNDNDQELDLKNTVFDNGSMRKRVNKLIALTVSFVICWLPFFLIRTLSFAVDIKNTSIHKWWAPLYELGMFNSSFTTVLNPLLFSVMSTKFRKALKKLWYRRFRNHNLRTGKYVTTQAK